MATSTRFPAALRILALIAAQRPRSATSQALADSLGANPVVVRRLLSRLAAAGLTDSRLGKNGGAVLARPPKKITLLDIYRAVEPGVIITRPPTRTVKAIDKAIDKIAAKGEAAFYAALEGMTLKAFLKAAKPSKRA